MNTFKKMQRLLFNAIRTLPEELFPLDISHPVHDPDTGCDFSRVDFLIGPNGKRSVPVLHDIHNAGLMYSVAGMQAQELTDIIEDARNKNPQLVPQETADLAASVGTMKRALYEHMEETERKVSEKGPNMSYCESIDFGDTFPVFLDILVKGDIPGEDDPERMEYFHGTLAFLAQNGRYIPEGMKDKPYEILVSYILHHQDSILDQIAEDISYYD